MKLHIKNMVSICCKKVVKTELKKLGLYYVYVNLGEAEVSEPLSVEQCRQLSTALQKFGLVLMGDKKEILVEKINNAIVEWVQGLEMPNKTIFSDHIVMKLHHHYNYLSRLFSEATGYTIENFIILHKIERVKELMFYDEYNLTEISFMMNYSSVAHLSNQFKKVTGMTPSDFKRMNHKRQYGLDEILAKKPGKNFAMNGLKHENA
jgi:AraC-like DNA-binding protein